jgi:hypothetical protein
VGQRGPSGVVIRFDIPDPFPIMEKCGADRILRLKKVCSTEIGLLGFAAPNR